MDNRLPQAIAAARGGQTKEAQYLLTQLLQDDPTNAQAWFLLGNLVEDAEQKEAFLQKAVTLEPAHEMAQMQLAAMETAPAAAVAISTDDDMLAQARGDTLPNWLADDADHLRLEEVEVVAETAVSDPDDEALEEVPDWLQETAAPAAETTPETAVASTQKPKKAATSKAKPAKAAKQKKGQDKSLTFILYALIAVAIVVALALGFLLIGSF